MDHASIPIDMALALAVWSMNQTAGPDGISPQSLVLGVNSRMPVKPVNLPGHRERCQAIAEARADMVKLWAQARMSKAFRERLPRAAELDVGPGTRVLVFREKSQKWEGPYMVEGSDGKLLWLNIKNQLKLFSIHQIKVYKPSITPVSATSGTEETAASRESEPTGTAAADAPPRITGATTPAVEAMAPNATTTANMSVVINGTSPAAHNVSDGSSSADALVNSVGRRIGEVARREHRGSTTADDQPSLTFITEVLKPGDPSATSEPMELAKNAEADRLKLRCVWEKVYKDDMPDNANILGARFVLAIKQPNTPTEVAKAHYVAQGCGDRDKPFIVHNLSMLRQSSTKVILSTSAVFGWRLFSHDINQVYLQIKDAMARDLYVKVRPRDAKSFGLHENELLRMLKPLYGVPEPGDYWEFIFVLHVKEDLVMDPRTGDPALFLKKDAGDPGGIGAYVDDSCMGGNKRFQDLMTATLDRFESKPRVFDDFTFIGVSVRTLPGPPRSFTLDQTLYVWKVPWLCWRVGPCRVIARPLASVGGPCVWL